ncbi:MAG: polymerase, bacteriophage-type protein [Parcubacteria group bacterium GW2011_GWB1_52_7]|nr:MAG: polymerase, bacteriophage-type protein [Parcubacteria group bacterium GW2011_GWB1_52_7]
MTKTEALTALEKEMEADDTLPLKNVSYMVFGEGNPDAEVLFIGEAPGFHEDRLKRPFVGTAGKLLDKLIGEIGWRREEVYITNIVKRRPPENRDPEPEEIEAYKPYLTRQVEIINPKAIVPLGRYSMNYFLPEAKISRDQGKIFWVDGKKIIPMFHPAAALRAGAVMETLRQSFRKLPELILEAPVSGAAEITPQTATEESKTPSLF